MHGLMKTAGHILLISTLATATAAAQDAAAEQTSATLDVQRVVNQARDAVVVITAADREGRERGIGTGFAIAPEGLIVTNLHVIGEGRRFAIQTRDNRSLEVVDIHAWDRLHDLAVVRVKTGDQELPALPLGTSAEIPEGLPVVMMGNPLGLKYSVVSGVVSGSRELDGRPMLQLAIPVEPGNSGGPVLDAEGRVRGIITMKSVATRNLGFAIGVDALRPLLERPNTVPLRRWLTIGALDPAVWETRFGADWRQRGGRITVSGTGSGFGGRSLCIARDEPPELPYEVAVDVRLDNESGAAGLAFYADDEHKHFGFYPSSGRVRLSRFDGRDVLSWQVLREVAAEPYLPNDWNHLKVRIEADKILCFLNDRLVIEAPNEGLLPGRCGLAKFRETEAEFRRFQVGAELPPSQVPADTAAQINRLIEKLPDFAGVQQDQLDTLVDTAEASDQLLRRRARDMERQAEQLKLLASDIYVRGVVRELQQLVNSGEDFDLLRGALLIARLDEREVDVESYLRQVDQMAAQIKEDLPADADEPQRLAALDQYLFEENGFHGNRFDFYHPANSYLNRVIDDRVGLPITLSILYMELAERLDLKIEGVGLPGRFMVRFLPTEGEPTIIDVFNDAHRPRLAELRAVVQGTGQQLNEDHLRRATHRDIMLRVLGNLRSLAERATDREALLRYLEAILALTPESIGDRGMRAMIRSETGRRQAALEDIDWILEREPPELDLEQIRRLREFIRTRPASLLPK